MRATSTSNRLSSTAAASASGKSCGFCASAAWTRPSSPSAWHWSAIPRPPPKWRTAASRSPATGSAGSTINSSPKRRNAPTCCATSRSSRASSAGGRSAGTRAAPDPTRAGSSSRPAAFCTTAMRTTMIFPTGPASTDARISSCRTASTATTAACSAAATSPPAMISSPIAAMPSTGCIGWEPKGGRA